MRQQKAIQLKRHLQARRNWQHQLRKINTGQPWPYSMKGLSRIGSKKKPKQPTVSQRQITKQFLKKAGLYKTKAQRRAEHAMLENYLGYKIPILSKAVGKPGNYQVKRRETTYNIQQKGEKGYYRHNRFWDIDEWVPEKPAVKIPIGERLVLRKHSKRGGSGRTSGSGERGSHVTGSAASRTGKAKTRGMKPGREPKKKKQK